MHSLSAMTMDRQLRALIGNLSSGESTNHPERPNLSVRGSMSDSA
jgi:hypothetical protein